MSKIFLLVIFLFGTSNMLLASSSDDLEESSPSSISLVSSPEELSEFDEGEVKRVKLQKVLKKFKPKKLDYEILQLILDEDTGAITVEGVKSFATHDVDFVKVRKKGIKKGRVIQYWTRTLKRTSLLPLEEDCEITF